MAIVHKQKKVGTSSMAAPPALYTDIQTFGEFFDVLKHFTYPKAVSDGWTINEEIWCDPDTNTCGYLGSFLKWYNIQTYNTPDSLCNLDGLISSAFDGNWDEFQVEAENLNVDDGEHRTLYNQLVQVAQQRGCVNNDPDTWDLQAMPDACVVVGIFINDLRIPWL
jgi:hypothetical protein